MAAAEATLSESTPRLIGIRTAWSAAASQRSGAPALGVAASGLLWSGGAADAAEEATSAAAADAAGDGAAAANDSGTAGVEDVGAQDASPGGSAAEEESNVCTVGGQSFSAGTKVVTASGALIAISKLKVGEKVKATNVKTGKTTNETVSAVLVHHDTNRYDLRVKTAHGIAVIDTTRNHLFWDVTSHRWVKAGALKYGTHLRTPSGGRATVLGGHDPSDRSGSMWDLTVLADHDFYVAAGNTSVLVHNCGGAAEESPGIEREVPGSGGDCISQSEPRRILGQSGRKVTSSAFRRPWRTMKISPTPHRTSARIGKPFGAPRLLTG
jgi:hypothetical protein